MIEGNTAKKVDVNEQKTSKLPIKRVLAYASTDTGGNLLYCTLTSFIMYFYTDVFGISIASAGLILLVARIFDALDAPVWGLVIDHTRTKWGKSRPYWLWLSVPFGLMVFLSFLAPDVSPSAKVVYALITYILAGIVYTGIGTPITAILPNLTNNSTERVRLNSWRSNGGMIGYLITASFTLPLVSFFGNGKNVLGFRITVGIYAVVALALLLFAFAGTKEINTKSIKSIPIKQSLKAVKGNWPWITLVLAFIFYWLGNTARTSTVIYYSEYNLHNKNLASVLNGLVIFQMVSITVLPFIVKRFLKTHTQIIGFVIAAIGQVIIAFAGNSASMVIFGWIVASLGTGIAVTLPFAMLSDTVDYGELKTGIRASGFLTAIGSSFCIKLGSGLGSFIPSVIMEKAGYVANVTQSAASLAAIKFCFTWLPAIFFIVGAIIMLNYIKYEKNEANVRKRLL
ncbi:MFS transporter [Bacillus ginsengihumi]|uniref:MFS transporter n=1 Tax=Heyndrickxia ginsengihumi TaxID=363870 RepID=A0A6M0P3S8_9BACI|nr:MFS transporter [Heyndrickxia ginsengihumi]MCM3022317.1 MFS transporter [Heyndrickxia ginsengihumi]NEY18550.1 MFS transporter [Heyndrickxia ginsengihumi]